MLKLMLNVGNMLDGYQNAAAIGPHHAIDNCHQKASGSHGFDRFD